MNLVEHAKAFAIERHGGQQRKYTGEPYWYHLRNVAEILTKLGCHPVLIAAAWLHDCLEDTETKAVELEEHFGPEVYDLVFALTDFASTSVNRATRKAMDRRRLAASSPPAQTIKLADLIDNTASIVKHDPDFARVYLDEKEKLLLVLTRGEPALIKRAWETLIDGQRALVQHALGGK